MPQPKQISWTQLRVGLLVLVSVTIFAILVFLMTGEGLLQRRYVVSVFMEDAGGLRTGDPVRLAGIDIGNVREIRISNSNDPKRAVEVILRILRKYQEEIREDSVASLDAEGLLGQRFLNITRGNPVKPVIQPGSELKLRQAAEIREILATSGDVVEKLNSVAARMDRVMEQVESGKGSLGKIIYDDSLYQKANQTVDNAQRLIANAIAGKGTLGRVLMTDELYNDLRASLTKMDQIVDEVRKGQGSAGKFIYDPGLYNRADQLVTRANNAMADVEKGRGTLGKFLKDETLYNRANNATASIERLAGRLDRGEGSAGKLLHDPALYNNANTFTLELRTLIADFRQNPKKFLTINFKLF